MFSCTAIPTPTPLAFALRATASDPPHKGEGKEERAVFGMTKERRSVGFSRKGGKACCAQKIIRSSPRKRGPS